LSKEDREYKDILTHAMERWHKEGEGKSFASWLYGADQKTYKKLTAGMKPSPPRGGYHMGDWEKERVIRDFAEVMGLPAKKKTDEGKTMKMHDPDLAYERKQLREHDKAEEEHKEYDPDIDVDRKKELRNKRARENRHAREDAYHSAGLKKVKGALGGTYWE
jgi:hypothetical protein